MNTEVCRLTDGPGYHWFGYYDKLEFDPSDNFVLGMETPFEGRSPSADDVIKVGMVDTGDDNRWIELGETRAWCWQQGCMLQWVPGKGREIMWNDREEDRFVCRLMNVDTGGKRTIESPVYSVSPDGEWGVTPDFGRIWDLRPGYGYAGVPDNRADQKVPDDTGIWRVEMATGKRSLVMSYAEAAGIPWPGGDISKARHYFNHLLISPNGSRFEFLHRWIMPNGSTWTTRMFTCKPDGSDLRIVADSGYASHFIWRDSEHILVCCEDAGEQNMCLINIFTREIEVIDSSDLPKTDGHFSYLPYRNNEWILTDGGSNPGSDRMLDLVLYHIPTGRVEKLGSFHRPEDYNGEFRVDLHPRISRDGNKVVIDSAHENGRQLYMLDITGLTG